jgi:O-antigen ligase
LLKTNPDGNYTTSAFEWGWLDIWLKMGLIGLLVYGSLLLQLIKRGWTNVKLSLGDKYSFGLTITLISMIIVHFFTPYLNHPLGLGWLMLAIIFLDNRS